MSRSCWCLTGGLAALAIATMLALAAWLLPDRIDARVMSGIREQVVWQPDSPEPVAARFRGDVDPRAPPVHARYRFFNITNLAAVRQGARPALEEVGPYTFRMVRQKTAVQWVDGGAAVRWREYRYHLWEPALSNGSLGDPITTLNLPLVGALEFLGSLPAGKASWLLELLLGWVERLGDPRVQGLFTTRPVRELLWGYEDPLLAKLAKFAPSVNPTFRLAWNMSSPAEAALDFPTQANTGLRNLSEVWQYQEWENVTAVTSWNAHAEAVRGTDAFQFRPGLALNDSVAVWVGELFRAGRLVARERARLGGVPLLRLRADPAQGDPDPRFFQSIRGLMNVTAPTAAGPGGRAGKPGPPIFLSYPHYCGADPALAQGVTGVACDPAAHNLFVDVEPNTGITLRAAKRLMMSSWFGPRWRSLDPLLRPTFLPVFWAELASQAKPAQLQQFKPLLRARAVQRALEAQALPVAALLTLGALACLCAAAVLRSEGGGGEGGGEEEEGCSGDGKRVQAAEAGAAWEEAGGTGEEQQLQEPLLESHPVEASPSVEPEAPTVEARAAAAPEPAPAGCIVQ